MASPFSRELANYMLGSGGPKGRRRSPEDRAVISPRPRCGSCASLPLPAAAGCDQEKGRGEAGQQCSSGRIHKEATNHEGRRVQFRVSRPARSTRPSTGSPAPAQEASRHGRLRRRAGRAYGKPPVLAGENRLRSGSRRSVTGLNQRFGVHGNAPPTRRSASSTSALPRTVRLAGQIGVRRVITFSGCPGDSEDSKYRTGSPARPPDLPHP